MDPHDERASGAEPGTDAVGSARLEPVDDDGDRSLIRWMLSLTPAERLEVLQRQVEAILALRAGT